MNDQTQTIRIVIDARPAKDGGEDAKRALQGIEQQTGKMGASIDRMGDKLSMAVGHLKGMAVAAAIAWGAAFAGQALNAAAGLDELSEQLGITTRFLQASQLAAAQSGAKLEQLEAGYGKFSQKMGEAADGTKAMIDALQSLGVKNLDVVGKLRPTEDIMQDVATAIVAIEDPAKKAAAAVDFFGKSGARLLPMMGDLAKGTDYMAAQAERLGTMIDDKAVKKLDEWADASERAGLKLRATFVNGVADAITWLEKLEEKWSKSASADNGWLKGLSKDLTSFVDGLNVAGVRASAMFIESFAALPERMGKLFTDAMNAAIGAVEWGLNAINRGFAEKAPWAAGKLGVTADAIKLPRLEGGGASFGDYTGRVQAAGNAAGDKMLALQATARAQAERQAFLARQAGFEDDETAARVGRGITTPARGASTTAVKGAGGETAKRIEKLLGDGQMAADYGAKIAEAAKQGSAAVEELEARYKATKAAQDAYGDSAKANVPAVQALAEKLYDLGKAADKAKNLTEFRLGTEGIRNDTELLAAEVRLANELPEIRARELAIIKATQEVQKRGIADSQEDLDRRIAAVTQQDLLKQKIEKTKKASDLWLEPIKGALQSIQATAADAWQGILESGTISFQSLGDVFKKTIIRMAAEFLALATIRPVMSVLVQGASSMGFLSGGQAASMGYGGGAGGGFSTPSLGGGSSMFGGLGDWLNTPFTGAYAGMSPSSMQGVPMLSGAAGAGITPLGALGAAAGVGMGAYQLATSRTTAGTIGGIGTMIGAGVSLIPGMAPIGMGISLLSSILPGLFGGETAPMPPLSGANTRFDPGAGGYVQSGSQQNGGGSINGQFAGIGSTLDAFFNAAGGLTNPGNAFGAAVWNNQREGTTSTYLLSPTQGSNQQTYDESGDPAKAIDRLIAKAFYNSIQNNAAMNASPTLRTAFSNREPTSTAQISGLFDLIQVYDQLGKSDNITAAERALKEIDANFASLSAGAREWGLSMAPITAEITKQRKAYAEDFLHTIDSVLDPVGTALDDFAKEREAGMKEWVYINDNVKEIVIAQAKVEEYYARKEAALKEQLYGGAVSQLEDAIKRLMPGGSLSNLDPVGTLAGLRASYRATYSQAAAGDGTAIARLAGEGIARADFEKAYYAGSPEYNAMRDEILANFQTIQAAIQSPAGSSTPLNTNDPGIQTLVQQNQILQQAVQTLVENDRRKSEEVTRLTNLLSRYLTNGQRAA